MHFTRHSTYETAPVPIIVRGEGVRVWTTRRQELPRRAVRAVRRAGRPRPHRARRGRGQAGGRARVLPAVVLRAPGGDRPRRAARLLRPGRPEPGLLHHRRRRGGRDRLEAGQAVLQAHRQAHQAQGDLPLGRLPRHPAGRAVDHRHPRRQGAVRAARARRVQGAEHQPLPRARAPARRREGVRPLGRRPDRRGDRVRGPRHRRRRLPRAGAELRRLLPAAARLLRAGPRDLRRVRRAAGLRRGDLRVRPDRLHVRLQRLRLRAGHDHLRQGHDLGLLPHRRDDRLRPAVRAVLQGAHQLPARVHLRRPPGLGRGRDGQPRHLRARGPQRPRARAGAGVPQHAGEAARPADRRRRPRRRVLLRDRAGQGQDHPGDLRRRRVRAAAARVPVQGAVRRRALLPRRRPRRPRRPARAAAGRRAEGVRRDGADPALGADGGVVRL